MEGRVIECFGGSGVLVGMFVGECCKGGISFGAVGVDLVSVGRWDRGIHGMGWGSVCRDCGCVGVVEEEEAGGEHGWCGQWGQRREVMGEECFLEVRHGRNVYEWIYGGGCDVWATMWRVFVGEGWMRWCREDMACFCSGW